MTRGFLWAAGAGFVATLALHLAALRGVLPERHVLVVLFIFSILVGFAAVIGHPDARQDEPGYFYVDVIKGLTGCPWWVIVTIILSFWYCLFFAVAHADAPRSFGLFDEPYTPLMAQFWTLIELPFYSISFGLLYTKIQRGLAPI